MRITKTTTYLFKAGTMAILAGMPLLAGPSAALADTSTPSGVIGEATKRAHGNEGDTLSAGTLNEKIKAIAAWVLGLAVVIFVLKVVLTAVDRMLNDNRNGERSFLVNIPIIGAYPQPEQGGYGSSGGGYTWKRVWINFAVQLVIAIGAWLLVGLVTGLLSGIFNQIG